MVAVTERHLSQWRPGQELDMSAEMLRWRDIRPSVFEYLPFGAGPRMCLGITFALQEMSLMLALIVQRFRLQLVGNQDISHAMHAVILGPRRLVMKVHAQDRAFTVPPRIRGTVHELVEL